MIDATTAGFICLFGLIFLMMMGVPIVFALGFPAVIAGLLRWGGTILLKAGGQPFFAWYNVNWLALPLFVLLGSIMAETPMGEHLFEAGRRWLSRVRGGLIASGILGEAVMSAALGMSSACILVIGKMADKEFTRHGYNRAVSFGALLAGGCLGPLIPPSVVMIIYAAITEESLGKLFMAGVIPGVIMAGLLVIMGLIVCRVRPQYAPATERFRWSERLYATRKIWPMIIVIVAILGSIYMGIATPTEAAGLGCVVALILGFTLFGMRWDGLRRAGEGAAFVVGLIMFMFAGSYFFTYVVGSANVGAYLHRVIEEAEISPWAVMAMINIVLLILGCFISPLIITFLMLPFLHPLVTGLGFDGIWFGIVFLINTQIGLITPPMGGDLFVVSSVFDVPTGDLLRGVLPFLGVLLLVLVLVIALPQLSLWLPSMMLGR